MKDKHKKWLFIGLEVLLLVAMSLILYFILATKPLLEVIELSIYQIFPVAITIGLILKVDVAWIIMVFKFSFTKNIYIKIILT